MYRFGVSTIELVLLDIMRTRVSLRFVEFPYLELKSRSVLIERPIKRSLKRVVSKERSEM